MQVFYVGTSHFSNIDFNMEVVAATARKYGIFVHASSQGKLSSLVHKHVVIGKRGFLNWPGMIYFQFVILSAADKIYLMNIRTVPGYVLNFTFNNNYHTNSPYTIFDGSDLQSSMLQRETNMSAITFTHVCVLAVYSQNNSHNTYFKGEYLSLQSPQLQTIEVNKEQETVNIKSNCHRRKKQN